MGEPGRYPQHAAILSSELETNPSAVRWRSSSDIDRDVVDGTHEAAHQFSLRSWLLLVVEAPKNPFSSGARVVVLWKGDADATYLEFAALICFHEPAALISKHARLDQDDTSDFFERRKLKGHSLDLDFRVVTEEQSQGSARPVAPHNDIPANQAVFELVNP